jgi:IS5 family transposase
VVYFPSETDRISVLSLRFREALRIQIPLEVRPTVIVLYGQRALSEAVFSTIKRTLCHAVRARAWYREFREVVLMCAVYNSKRTVKQ